jgi:hypothetical protein
MKAFAGPETKTVYYPEDKKLPPKAQSAGYTLGSAGRSCALNPEAADQASSSADRAVRHCVPRSADNHATFAEKMHTKRNFFRAAVGRV